MASSPPLSTFNETASASVEQNVWSEQAGPSFAEALRSSNSHTTNSWPTLSSTRKSQPEENINHRKFEITDPDTEDYKPPTYRPSLGDSLAQALQQSNLPNPGNEILENSSKKKRKKPKITEFDMV